jgi:hypothetical protein
MAREAVHEAGAVSPVPAPLFAYYVLLGTLATVESHPAILASDPKLLETLHVSFAAPVLLPRTAPYAL